ncbi:MAG: hypothetical protein Kapaf2KO_08480 [Candidatus Kapaibacteriales bacterium]
MRLVNILAISFFVFFFISCKENKTLYELSPISENGNYLAIITIPAGTSELYEYDTNALTMRVKNVDGKDEIYPHLPFPVNYGFIPSTYSDLSSKNLDEPLELFILTASYSKTTLMEVLPIATMEFLDEGGKAKYIPVAVPYDKQFRTLDITSWEGFESEATAKEIIQIWASKWKESEGWTFQGWKDESFTKSYLEERTIKENIRYKSN